MKTAKLMVALGGFAILVLRDFGIDLCGREAARIGGIDLAPLATVAVGAISSWLIYRVPNKL